MAANQAEENYSWIFPYITEPIGSIVEVGSRDGLDAIWLAKAFDSQVDAFEASPRQFKFVEENIEASALENVRAHELALSDQIGHIEFWETDVSEYENSGLGSLFEVNFSNRTSDDVDAGRSRIQHPIKVRTARYDSLSISPPDLLVMDVQGSEVLVLRGFGRLLSECRFIACEAERVPSYKGGNSFRELNRFMSENGFHLVATTIGKGDRRSRWINYFRTNTLIAFRNRTFRPYRFYQGCFDVLYQNSRERR